MSRHEIQGLDAKHEVVVGWDRPLDSFFGQVYDTTMPEDADNIVFWVGASVPWLRDLDDLIAAMADYAVLSPEIRYALILDRALSR